MSTSSGPNLVTDGLILALDAGNAKSSFHKTNNLINNSEWLTTGSGLPWPNNGNSAQNQLIFDIDPWGTSSLVCKTVPDSGVNGANGGWEGCAPGYWVNIDPSKKYRSCVWVRRVSANTSGTFYHGLHTNGTGDVLDYSGNSQTNPYWACQNIGYLTQNVWYLHVGHINPYGVTGVTDPTSGYWTQSGGWISNPGCNIGGDASFPSNATVLRNRVYHYYSADPNSNIELFYPRIDCCDGTEPSIEDILNTAPYTLYDQSGYGNHHVMSDKPVYSGTEYNGQFTLNGSTQGFKRTSALNGVSSTCTVVLWYKTTDTQELWVQGVDGSWYLSASASNNYYHGNCGSPTNYVDTLLTTRPDSPINYRNGNYHMWEAKNVNFSSWQYFYWFTYGGGWQMSGSVAKILVYNRNLTADESRQNYAALRGRYGL